MKWKSLSCVRLFATPWPIQSMEFSRPRILEWVAFPFSRGSSQPRHWTQHWGCPHCRWILYQLSHQGRPRILEWVAYPFSSRSSWSRNQTRVSCIADRFFTNWAIIREALVTLGDWKYCMENSFSEQNCWDNFKSSDSIYPSTIFPNCSVWTFLILSCYLAILFVCLF